MTELNCCISCLKEDNTFSSSKDDLEFFKDLINIKLPFVFTRFFSIKFCTNCSKHLKLFANFKARSLQSISNLEKVLWERGTKGGSFDVATELKKIIKEEDTKDFIEEGHEEYVMEVEALEDCFVAPTVDVLEDEDEPQSYKTEVKDFDIDCLIETVQKVEDVYERTLEKRHCPTGAKLIVGDEQTCENEENFCIEDVEENIEKDEPTYYEQIETTFENEIQYPDKKDGVVFPTTLFAELIPSDFSEELTWNKFCSLLRPQFPRVKKVPRDDEIFQQLDCYCEVCAQQVSDMEEHVRTCHFMRNQSTLRCMKCDEKFKQYPGLDHFDVHRVMEVDRRCDFCPLQFENVYDLKRHLERHFYDGTGFLCKCGKEFQKENLMRLHIAVDHLDRLVCNFCFNSYVNKVSYKKHRAEERNVRKKEFRRRKPEKTVDEKGNKVKFRKDAFTKKSKKKIESEIDKTIRSLFTMTKYCSVCNDNFPEINKHIEEAHFLLTEENKLECLVCLTMNASSNYSARAHFNTKHREFEHPHPCSLCDQTFLSLADYKTHLSEHANKIKRFECDHCGATFNAKPTLRYHIVASHSSNKICKYCNREFEDVAVYQSHMKVEREKRTATIHVCDICGFGTRHKRYLNDHIARRHSDHSAWVECDECGKWCKTAQNLKDHKLNTHREKHLACEFCGKSMRNQSLLKEHIKVAHPTQLVSCDICGKLVNPVLMKRHRQLAHTNERPFQCSVCTLTFKAKSTLLKHLHTHSGTRPHNCLQCDQGYYNRQLLAKHYQTAHNVNYTMEEMKHLSKRMPSAIEVEEVKKGEL